MSKYKTTGKQTLFDAENAAQKLSEIGNPLEKLESVIDFEMFRSRFEDAMVNHNTKSKAGAKQCDEVMMV
ncbi:MAG: IS5/IS1182 family transposase, partial [Bacteroidales bacterium]|nr:IS5/IS1182 family transposase [Bacteroidales bacterium]